MTTQRQIHLDFQWETSSFTLAYKVIVTETRDGRPLYSITVAKLIGGQTVAFEETGAFTDSAAIAKAVYTGLVRNQVTPMGLFCAADVLLETQGGL